MSWTPILGKKATYKATLYGKATTAVASCSTSGKSCTITSAPAGSYTVAVTATIAGATGRAALSTVTVIAARPSIKESGRGDGKAAKRVYATVVVPTGADPAKTLVWTLVPKAGTSTWSSRSAILDTWTCRYARGGSVCQWSTVEPARVKVKFSVNGMFTQVATYPNPKRR